MYDLLLPAGEHLHPGQTEPVPLTSEHTSNAACTLPYNLFNSLSASRQVFFVKQGIENISLTSMWNCFSFSLTLTAVAAISCQPFCSQSGHDMGKRLLNYILSVFFIFFVLLLRIQHPGWKSFPLIYPSNIAVIFIFDLPSTGS
jgi:hypothetical protein